MDLRDVGAQDYELLSVYIPPASKASKTSGQMSDTVQSELAPASKNQETTQQKPDKAVTSLTPLAPKNTEKANVNNQTYNTNST